MVNTNAAGNKIKTNVADQKIVQFNKNLNIKKITIKKMLTIISPVTCKPIRSYEQLRLWGEKKSTQLCISTRLLFSG